MSQVILTPIGWKLLPDTVSCPEKPQCICETQGFDACEKAIDDYHNAVREASRHLVDIAEEDWAKVQQLVLPLNGTRRSLEYDTVYTIDAEFEVGWEIINQWDGDDIPVTTDPDAAWIDRRQIARLVKPKEKQNNDMKDPIETGDRATATNTTLPDFKKYTLLNPTDSVTSDGTKPKWVEPTDWTKHGHFEPTETQDELWEEVAQSIINHVQVMPELKKRFRIQRI